MTKNWSVLSQAFHCNLPPPENQWCYTALVTFSPKCTISKQKFPKNSPTPLVAFGHSFVRPHTDAPNEIPGYSPAQQLLHNFYKRRTNLKIASSNYDNHTHYLQVSLPKKFLLLALITSLAGSTPNLSWHSCSIYFFLTYPESSCRWRTEETQRRHL